MICKITVGNGLRGAVNYDLIPKKGEPARAEWICGTLQGTPKQISRQAAPIRALRPNIKNPIWRCSLSLPSTDGIKSSQFWETVTQEFLNEMGIPLDSAWCAVRHSDKDHDHIHISVLRILPDSKLWDRANDLPKAVQATQKLEMIHGLSQHSREKPFKNSQTRVEKLINERKGKPMSKSIIQNAIDSIFADHPNGIEYEEFKRLLLLKKINIIQARTKKHKLQGFSFEYENNACPGSALGSGYGSNGLINRGLIIHDQDEIDDVEKQEDSKQAKNKRMPHAVQAINHKQLETEHSNHNKSEPKTKWRMDINQLNNVEIPGFLGPIWKACMAVSAVAINYSLDLWDKIKAFIELILSKLGIKLNRNNNNATRELNFSPESSPIIDVPSKVIDDNKQIESAANQIEQIAKAIETKSPELIPHGIKGRDELVKALADEFDKTDFGTGIANDFMPSIYSNFAKLENAYSRQNENDKQIIIEEHRPLYIDDRPKARQLLTNAELKLKQVKLKSENWKSESKFNKITSLLAGNPNQIEINEATKNYEYYKSELIKVESEDKIKKEKINLFKPAKVRDELIINREKCDVDLNQAIADFKQACESQLKVLSTYPSLKSKVVKLQDDLNDRIRIFEKDNQFHAHGFGIDGNTAKRNLQQIQIKFKEIEIVSIAEKARIENEKYKRDEDGDNDQIHQQDPNIPKS